MVKKKRMPFQKMKAFLNKKSKLSQYPTKKKKKKELGEGRERGGRRKKKSCKGRNKRFWKE